MRRFGESNDEKAAERFVGFLAAHGVDAQVRDGDGPGHFELWAMDEDHLEKAGALYREFLRAPNDPRYAAVPPPPARPAAGDRTRYVDARQEIQKRGGRGPVTIAVIVLSVFATYLTTLPGATEIVRSLYYSEYYGRGFPEILDGQVWRLVTPIFMHGGVWHLLFNMWWMWDLCGTIERQEGSRYAALMILIFGTLCNTSQYLVSGPLFVGMSGVVYGMLGYIWIMGRYDPHSRYFLPQGTLVFIGVWTVLCVLGIIPNVANTQHISGFIYGSAWGFLRSGRIMTLRRRREYRNKL